MNCRNKITSLALVLVGSCYGLTASAKCGSVDYTQGADALAHDARLRGHHDALCALPCVCLCSYHGYYFCATDIHQDEHRRRWHYQIHHDPDWSHHFHD